MASDFVVIVNVRQHYGNERGVFGPELTFAGNNKDFTFDCPGIDTRAQGILLFQTRDVDNETNFFNVNGHDIPGGIPRSAARDDWNGNVAIVGGGWLQESGNVLQIGARDERGSLLGNLDDFLIDNIVLFYRTRGRPDVFRAPDAAVEARPDADDG
jgi:hypothetical protein